MKKILSVVGARPQFIKAAPVSKAIRKHFCEILVHTGQHYDDNMSHIFFDELNIPRPDYDLEVGSGHHGYQTGRIMERLEKILVEEKPDMVLVYGDTNSTLAGALSATKLDIPVGHIEAGLRSYNRAMPEEVNRILSDHCSNILFCPTRTAVLNLEKEGIQKQVFQTGDVMYDASLMFSKMAEKDSSILSKLQCSTKSYLLCTIHRAENTDVKNRLKHIVKALIRSEKKIIFPVHPRTLKNLKSCNLLEIIGNAKHVHLINPVGYPDMIQLEKNAIKILTDSGGIQKEAYFYAVPCVTLRDETEWIETVEDGWNILAGADDQAIIKAVNDFMPQHKQTKAFGDGTAGTKITKLIYKYVV